MEKTVQRFIQRKEEWMNMMETPLFDGIDETGQEAMRRCGGMRKGHFEKNETIFHTGDQVCEVGTVLLGGVNIETNDLWGNRSILSHVPAGQVFAETYALCREPMMVDAVASEASEILFLNLKLLLHSAHAGTVWQPRIIQNLLQISAQKNLALSGRIFCTTPKTIRGRLLVYLSAQSAKAKSTAFRIPFDRQGLADYLNLDRSALSKELGKMRDEGILEFHKNRFILHKR